MRGTATEDALYAVGGPPGCDPEGGAAPQIAARLMVADQTIGWHDPPEPG